MTIGDNIKKARKSAGLTQKELGKKLGISQSAIGQFEKSDNLNQNTLRKIADALEIPLADLYNKPILHLKKIDPADIIKDGNKTMLITYYDDLNDAGREEAVKRVEELTYIPKYKKDPIE